MERQKSSWTYNDFLAYILLYAANANLQVNDEEKKMLFSKVSFNEYEHVRKEFESENDYDRIQTIESFKNKYFNDEAGQDKLFLDLKDMFLADEKYDSIEKAIFMGLKRILK